MIKINKNIPIPRKEHVRSPWEQLFDRMNVGDSFTVPEKRGPAARSAAWNYASMQKGKAFTSRKIGNQVRVWRIK
jgi:hypothetical protein